MLTIATAWFTAAIVLTCVWLVINRRTISQDEMEELYTQAYNDAHGIKMFVGNDGKLILLDEMEQKISE